MAAIDRTAYPRYRRTITPRELAAFYTLHPDELHWVRQITRGAPKQLTCAFLLKAVQHLGYFPSLTDTIPVAIIIQLRSALDIPEDTLIGTLSSKTLYTYHRQIRERLGLITDERNARRSARHKAAAAILEAAQVQDNPADLINVAIDALIHQVELPAFSTLDRITRRIRTLVNQRIAQQVITRLSLEKQDRLLALLTTADARSPFADLKRTPKQATYKHLDELLDHLAWLDSLGSFGPVLTGIAHTKLQHFAAEAAALDASEMQDFNRPKQLLLIVSLIHRAQATCRDALVEMFRKRMAFFHKRARDLLEQRRKEQQALVEQLLRFPGGARRQPGRTRNAPATPRPRRHPGRRFSPPGHLRVRPGRYGRFAPAACPAVLPQPPQPNVPTCGRAHDDSDLCDGCGPQWLISHVATSCISDDAAHLTP